MPFRYSGNDIDSDVHNWSRRIGLVLKDAGVVKVRLVERSGIPAFDRHGNPVMKSTNVKMFRHTFAVGWLIAGAPKDTVARMLGHVRTDMIGAHYAPRMKGLDDAHIPTDLPGGDTCLQKLSGPSLCRALVHRCRLELVRLAGGHVGQKFDQLLRH